MAHQTETAGTWPCGLGGGTFRLRLVQEQDLEEVTSWQWYDVTDGQDGVSCELSGASFIEAVEDAAYAWSECTFEPPLEELTEGE